MDRVPFPDSRNDSMPADIRFNRELEFEYGVLETVAPSVRRVIARNPSP